MADLYSAVKEENLEKIQMYLERGVDVDSRGGSIYTALMEAVIKNQVDITKLLLKFKADVNTRVVGQFRQTPLMLAAENKHPDITALLLDHGAEVNAADKYDRTALHWCAKSGDIASALSLIQAGADINVGDSVDRRTPLMDATACNNVKVVKLLLLMMCDQQVRNRYSETALDLAKKKGNKEITKLLTGDVSAEPSVLSCSTMGLSNSQFNQLRSTLLKIRPFTILTTVNISNNKLTEIPGFPNTITFLDVSNNKIAVVKSVPSSLTTFKITNNHLTEIDGFPNTITFLDVSNNKITVVKSVPSSLNTFKIANNNLTEIDRFPNTITFLDASDNQIIIVKSVPSSLTSCNLTNNPITSLESKCLENENLASVLKKALTDIQIANLIQPPPEVFTRGHIIIQRYFKDASLSLMVETSTSRCVITGETTAGKTSLMKSLISGRSVLTDIEDRTQVLDVETWNISDGCSMQLYDTGGHTIYDITSTYFANNNSIILLVHNLSSMPSVSRTMTVLRRNLYQHPQNMCTFVLTHIDVIEEEEIAKRKKIFQEQVQLLLNQELDSLRLVQKDMEADDHTDKIPVKKMENKLTSVSDLIKMYKDKLSDSKYFTVSSKTMVGISELKDFLISTINKSRVKIPSKWITCYKQLHAMEKYFYTTEQFEQCYLQTYKGLEKIISSKSSRQSSASTCLTYLSDVGLVLTFPNHPVLKGYVFHDDHFLVSLFKSVFDHNIEKNTSYSTDDSLKAVFNEGEFQDTMKDFMENGILSHKLLRYLWGKYHLSQKDEQALVDALKLFDIFFEIQSSDRISLLKYFIPWLVKSKTAPEKITSPQPMNHKMISLQLEYTFNNKIPVNVAEQMFIHLQKFAVQHQYQGERYAWEDGLYIKLGSLEFALIRQHPQAEIHQKTQAQTHHQPHICLSVTGKVKDLDQIWTSFKDIYTEQKSVVEPWKGVIIRCDVICFHCILKSIDEPYRWNVAAVFPDEASKVVREVICPKSKELIPAALTHPLIGDATCKTEQKQAVVEYLKNHWLGKFSTLTDIMHPHPVILKLKSIGLLTPDHGDKLNRLSVSEKVKYLVEKLLLDSDTDHRDQLCEALRNTNYHTNVTLAKALAGTHSTGEPTVLPELLKKEEKQHIMSEYENLTDNIDPGLIIDHLYQDNTLDDYHYGQVQALKTRLDKVSYMLDNVLMRGTYQTVQNFRNAFQQNDVYWLLEYLPDRNTENQAGGETENQAGGK